MNVAVMKTKAELALGEQFATVAPRLPGGAWMRKLRADAMGADGVEHVREHFLTTRYLRDYLRIFNRLGGLERAQPIAAKHQR